MEEALATESGDGLEDEVRANGVSPVAEERAEGMDLPEDEKIFLFLLFY